MRVGNGIVIRRASLAMISQGAKTPEKTAISARFGADVAVDKARWPRNLRSDF
jgi:hypothetical protein